MKIFKSLLAAAALLVGTQSVAQFYVYVDGKEVYGQASGVVDSIRFAPLEIEVGGTVAQAVDLGTGVLWAVHNVGASKPEEFGDYFAWAETSPKLSYNWDSYAYMPAGAEDNTQLVTKYIKADGKTTLEAADDAATANWGDGWRMPTHAEICALVNQCTWTYVANYNNTGVPGYTVSGNGNTIFFPMGGYKVNSTLYPPSGYAGTYWSSTFYKFEYPGDARYLGLEPAAIGTSMCLPRRTGALVRAVKAK